MKVKPLTLDLRDGSHAHDVDDAMWRYWTGAAAVMLDAFHASADPPQTMSATVCTPSNDTIAAVVQWAKPDDRLRRSHGNETTAIEMGAYAVASLAVNALDGWLIIGRTPTESGADIWMIRRGDPPDSQVRLEVSGIARCVGSSGVSALRQRLSEKVTQLHNGKSKRPGIAAVVGFQLVRVHVSGMQR